MSGSMKNIGTHYLSECVWPLNKYTNFVGKEISKTGHWFLPVTQSCQGCSGRNGVDRVIWSMDAFLFCKLREKWFQTHEFCSDGCGMANVVLSFCERELISFRRWNMKGALFYVAYLLVHSLAILSCSSRFWVYWDAILPTRGSAEIEEKF